MNWKKEVLSLKELTLMGILIILVAYYFVVQGPIEKQTAEYESRLVKINSELQISQQKATKKIEMQREIDAMFAKYDGNPPITPEYNNINHIISELNGILGNTYDYNLSFGAEVVDEKNVNIIRRPIAISFSTANYNDAVSKIRTINESENKYLIQNISVSDLGANNTKKSGRYDIVITMTSFEYKADAAPSPENISQ